MKNEPCFSKRPTNSFQENFYVFHFEMNVLCSLCGRFDIYAFGNGRATQYCHPTQNTFTFYSRAERETDNYEKCINFGWRKVHKEEENVWHFVFINFSQK